MVSSSDEFSELSGMDDEPSYDVSPTWAAMLGDGGERTTSRSSRRSLECSQVEINIIGTHLVDGHTVYVVQLSLTGVKSWEVQRRFRDFIYLDKELRKKFPHLKMPSLPPKTFWFSSTDPALVDERRDHLENYLKTLTFIQQIWTRNDLVCCRCSVTTDSLMIVSQSPICCCFCCSVIVTPPSSATTHL